ncbi:MAG: hypothetical protein JPMHGGIA_01064 [Saprospiraceae bacterium]|jgi:hypothetical protein|nr:hypothetical protein [Saprospiraceae bacterium]
MEGKIKYEFSGKVWQHRSPGGWHFVSLPIKMAAEIRENMKWQEEGWGRLKAIACIGTLQWDTAIWFDKKANTYILPLKAKIRGQASIQADQNLNVVLWL